jgi:LPXTG-site transpeptidase (sortase) family protein
MPRRKTKKPKSFLQQNIPMILMVIGIFFMSLSAIHWYLRYQALSLDKELLAQYASYEIAGAEKRPVQIKIPWFVDVAISQQILIDNQWTIAEKEASYLANSARLGEAGNIIIYGHNTRQILGNIRALKGNEIITLTSAEGKEYLYQVSEIAEVDPNQTKYLLPTEEEVLTLYTCSGFMDQKRFIVRAKPI